MSIYFWEVINYDVPLLLRSDRLWCPSTSEKPITKVLLRSPLPRCFWEAHYQGASEKPITKVLLRSPLPRCFWEAHYQGASEKPITKVLLRSPLPRCFWEAHYQGASEKPITKVLLALIRAIKLCYQSSCDKYTSAINWYIKNVFAGIREKLEFLLEFYTEVFSLCRDPTFNASRDNSKSWISWRLGSKSTVFNSGRNGHQLKWLPTSGGYLGPLCTQVLSEYNYCN